MAKTGGGKSETSMQKELEELRSRVLALEEDNEMLMNLARNIGKLFATGTSDDDKLLAYKKGESKTINVVIQHVSKGNPITPAHFANIEKLSNTSTYADAEWLHNQLISAFQNLYFSVNKEKVWALTFEEVKSYLQDFSKMDEKYEVQTYVKNLKPKAKA